MSIQIPSDIRLSGEPGYGSNDISLPLSASTLLPCSSFLLHFFGWREEKENRHLAPAVLFAQSSPLEERAGRIRAEERRRLAVR